ncbi:expressed unknown protein [Seminavis robusta]|uniref:Uncharacterized protein n=1 Tax=Seminavis robusta TaxID=568900 RepID=A0A9N8HEQ1_9STRA|nr:expressed unknown protein [Seminavis robusta]|eukprot:Sro526_g160430.1 n/a (174) ;mRNA; f:37953-38474
MPFWNPCSPMKDAWTSTNSCWGKIGMLLFFFYVIYNLIDTLSNIVQPFAGYLPCLKETFAGNDNDTTLFVIYLFRMFHLWPFGFYLYAFVIGYTTPNIVMIMVFTSATAGWWERMVSDFQEGSSTACVQHAPSTWIILIGWPLLAIVLGEIDRRFMGDHGSVQENQSLQPDLV